MLLSLLITVLAWGEAVESTCTTLERAPIQDRQDILVSDMTTLFAESKGCVTVVELWASWCGPCVKIAPEVEAFHKSHPNVAFISISADATTGAAEKFWRSYPPIGQKYRLSRWTLPELQTVYSGIGATFPEAIPYFIVLDENGTLEFETHEPRNLNALNETIARLIDDANTGTSK